MPVSTKAKSRTHHRRKSRKHGDVVQYTLRVTGWEHYYSFRLSDPKYHVDTDTYSEFSVLTLKGYLLEPKSCPYRIVRLSLSSKPGLLSERYERAPTGIGSLNAHDETLSGYVFIPAQRMAELTAVAASGRAQIADMVGGRLRYRSGIIRSISVKTELEDDE